MAINLKEALGKATNAVKTFLTPKTGTLATAGRKLLQTEVKVSPNVAEAIRSIPTIDRGISNVKSAIKSNPLGITPMSWKSEIVPLMTSIAPGNQNVENTAYALRGALNLTPFQSRTANLLGNVATGKPIWSGDWTPSKQEQATNPTNQRQQTSQDIGQALYGTALTAQLGGPNILKNIGSRLLQGTALGTGMTAVGIPLFQGRLATGGELKQGAIGGAENSWQLAFTNTVTDKLAAKFFPKLTSSAVEGPFKQLAAATKMGFADLRKELFQEGAKRLFGRALLEVPAENTLFTAIDQLDNKAKEDFITSWLQNLPGNVAGNLLFAGLNFAFKGREYKMGNKEVEAAQNAIVKTAEEKGLMQPGVAGAPTKVENGPDLTNEELAMKSIGRLEDYRKTLPIPEPPYKTPRGIMPTYDINGNVIPGRLGVPMTLPTYDLNGNLIKGPEPMAPEPFLTYDKNGKVIKNPKVAPERTLPTYKEGGKLIKKGQIIEPPKPYGPTLPTEQEMNSLLAMRQLEKPIEGMSTETIIKEAIPETKVEAPAGIPLETKKQDNAGLVDSFENLFARWIGKRESSKTIGLQEALAQKVPQNMASEVIGYLEGTKTDVSPEVRNLAAGMRSRFDELFTKAKAAGMDIGYLQNYITHIWKQSPEDVKALYKSAKSTFGFSSERTIPTYEEGIKMGLTPKYDNPSAILGEYAQKMEETLANLDFVNNLKASNLIVKAGDLKKQEGKGIGYEPIIGPGFPSSATKNDKGQTVIGSYYAKTKDARVINSIFAEPSTGRAESIIRAGAKLAGGVQDIVLSGGIPKTPLNAWTLSQILFKELPSGRVVGPLKALYHSMVNPQQYFKDNLQYVQKMQEANIPVNIDLDLKSLNSGGWIEKTFGNSWGEAWNKTINEPTFKRFMPILQMEFYKDALNSNVRKYGQVEGERIAAQATKNFYGIITSDQAAQKGELGKNLKQIFLMAPTYRETILNFLGNNIKSLKNPLAPENRANVKWIVGAAVTYGIYDYLNVKANGHHMSENAPGLEDKLLIPAGETTIGIPFMSSILTVPRAALRVGGKLLEGDVKGAAAEAGTSGLSLALSPFAAIVKNEDYFGKAIVNESDSTPEKYKKMGLYILNSYNHPYIKEIIGAMGLDSRSKDDPTYQRISRALELPIRYYDTTAVDARWYYQAKNNAVKGLNPTEKAVYDKLYKPKLIDEEGLPISGKTARDTIANALDRLSNPKVVQAETQTALETAKNTGEAPNPFYLLSPQQQEVVLILKTFYPGDTKSKATIIDANKDWLQLYWKDNGNWIQGMKDSGKFTNTLPDNGKPQITPELQPKLDAYFAIPSGTGARTAYLMKNPDVQQYFEDNQNWTNAQRAELGLPLLASYGSSGSGGGKATTLKTALSKIPKYKAPKVKSSKVKKISPLKATKSTVTKLPKMPSISKSVYKPKAIKLSKPKGLPMTLSGLRMT